MGLPAAELKVDNLLAGGRVIEDAAHDAVEAGVRHRLGGDVQFLGKPFDGGKFLGIEMETDGGIHGWSLVRSSG